MAVVVNGHDRQFIVTTDLLPRLDMQYVQTTGQYLLLNFLHNEYSSPGNT